MQNSSAQPAQTNEYASLCAQYGDICLKAAAIENKRQQIFQAMDQAKGRELQEQAIQERVAAEKARELTSEGIPVD